MFRSQVASRFLFLFALICSAAVSTPVFAFPLQQIEPPTREAIEAAVKEAAPLIEEAEALLAKGEMEQARRMARKAGELLKVSDGEVDDQDHSEALWALGNLAMNAGEYALARESLEKVYLYRKAHLDKDDRLLMITRSNLANTCLFTGDLRTAESLDRQNLEYLMRVMPEDHSDVQRGRLNLAAILLEMGQTEEARSLLESAVSVLEKTVPEENIDLMRARMNLGVALARQGRHAQAAQLFARILTIQERVLSPHAPDLQRTRLNLAAMLRSCGDYSASYALHRKVLDVYEEYASENEPGLLMTRINFAVLCMTMGDLDGAEALLRKVLDVEGKVLPAGHPNFLLARENLGIVLESEGKLEEAEAMVRGLLEELKKSLPPDHPRILSAQATLSVILRKRGALDEVDAIQKRLLEKWSALFPPENEFLLSLKANMAETAAERGDKTRALALYEELAAFCEATFPIDNSYRRKTCDSLARCIASSGVADAKERLRPLMARAMAAYRAWIEGIIALPPRVAREEIAARSDWISMWLTIGDLLESRDLERELFSLVEEMRAVASDGIQSSARDASDPALEKIRSRALSLREEVNAMAASLGDPDEGARATTRELTEKVLERDRAVAGYRGALVASGLAAPRIDADRLAEALPEGSVAVGYRVFLKAENDGRNSEWLTAFVLHRSGALERVDLGPLAPVSAAIAKWRAAIGKPSGRGLIMEEGLLSEGGAEQEAGSALRALVLDQVLDVAGEATTLHVCVDDVLHLVPLDALPLKEGVVGDRFTVLGEISFARLLSKRGPIQGEPSLLAIGGVDFDKAVEPDRSAEPAAAPPVNLTRGRLSGGFAPLPATRAEMEWLGKAFEERFGRKPTLLVGGAATRAALYENAPKAMYIHLATHGYFADEGVLSWSETPSIDSDVERQETHRLVRGMAPMTLCGLALAGANAGMDSAGRVPGILTAEELAGLDLSGCDLAVLSACETNVGEKRAGQGILSLKSALHSAGARTAVTSLWMVDDEWTRELMQAFYQGMWEGGESKAKALWNAKCALRAAGAGVRDWASWVLTGEPE